MAGLPSRDGVVTERRTAPPEHARESTCPALLTVAMSLIGSYVVPWSAIFLLLLLLLGAQFGMRLLGLLHRKLIQLDLVHPL